MATRYAVGTGSWTLANTGIWSTTSGGGTGASVPTAADEVIFDGNTGTITIPTATTVPCRSITTSGTNTLAFASTSAIMTVGDATAGTGNVAVSIGASTTITLTGIGQINFVSTSSTVQTITSNGKTMPTMTINGAGSKYQFADACTSTGNLTYTAGAELDFNSFTHSFSSFTITGNANTRTVIFGTAVVNCTLFGGTAFTASSATNVTITASVGAQLNATNGNSPGINLGSLTYGNVAVSHTTSSAINPTLASTGATVYSYSRTTSAAKTESVIMSGTGITITNTLSLNGNSTTNRIFILSSVAGTAFTITNNGSNSITNADFQDIIGAGSASWNLSAITGNSGDCGGNSGITFTTGIDCYWVPQGGTSTGSHSNSNKWASTSGGTGGTARVPLPQDNVFYDANSIDAGSRTITWDMPRVGKNVSWTGATNTPTLAWTTALAQTFYGSVTFISGMTMSFGNTVNWVLAGRGNNTFDSGGKTFSGTNMSTTINCGTGKYTLASAYTTGHAISLLSGEFDDAGYTVTAGSFGTSGTIARTLTHGNSTWNFTIASATPWSVTGSNLTYNKGTATINISTASSSTRTFAGGVLNYYALNYTVAGSTGQLTVTGANTFDSFNFSDASNARTVTFPANTITTFRSLNIQGSASGLMSVISATSGTATTFVITGAPPVLDYLSVKDVLSAIPYKFYAGANSTNVSGNTNILFTAVVTQPYIFQTGDAGAVASNTTNTVNLPFAATAGSLLVLELAMQTGDPSTITPPSGFTLAKANNNATSAYIYIYYKIATGGETSFVSSWVNARVNSAHVTEITGWTGTPTLDTTDSNTAGSGTSVSTGAGATNSAFPAIAVGAAAGNGGMGLSISVTNSFHEDRTTTAGSNGYIKSAFKPFPSTTSSNTTTFTWSTARVSASALAHFIDVANTAVPRGGFVLFQDPGIL